MLLLIVTCAIYIWIGFYFSKKVKTASDFLIAGRNLPLPILAATIAATSFGGGCLVVGVQWGAERGLWVGMYSTIGAALACFINAFFAGKLRSLSCDITPADYIETRYGHSVFLRAYQSLVTPISILAIMGSQLISFGSVSTAFGIPYDIAVIIGVIVIIIYTYTSGMWGVAVSAFIQLAICIVFLPIVAYISLKLVGDNPLLMLQSMVKEPFFPGNKSISDFMYTVLPLVLGSIFSYESFLRYQCADNAKNAVKSSVIAGFILLFLAFPIGIIGAIGGSLFPNISSVQVLPQMISTTLPPLISVLFLAAILAAIMSTADSLMTSMSAIISRDIYNKLLHPNIEFNDLKNTLKYSQIASALTAIIGAIIALKFDSLLELLFWPAPLCTGVIFAPFVIGLCWKGATKKGAIYAVIVSVILALLNMIGILTVFDRILVPIIGGSITIFIVSKFSKKD